MLNMMICKQHEQEHKRFRFCKDQPPGVTATHQILILGLQVQILWGLLRVARITVITADS